VKADNDFVQELSRLGVDYKIERWYSKNVLSLP